MLNAIKHAPTTMTSRQRVARALRRQVPDRVPIGYSANPGIDKRLKAFFGLAENDGDGLREALGLDFVGIGVPYTGPRLHPEVPGRGVSAEWGHRTQYIQHESGAYWDFCDFPLEHADADALDRWPMPSPDHYDYENVGRTIQRHPDKAIFVGGAGLADIMNSTGFVRGVEQTLVDLAGEDEAVLRLIDRRLAVQYEVTRRCLEAGDGRIDFMWLGEDLGSQRGALISKDMFRRLIRPRHQRFIDLAKQYDLPVMIHSCGSSITFFDDLIEMGINVVDTLQPEAKDMSPANLKARFGDRLAFHGCISTAGPVGRGTVEQTIEVVRDTLKVMMPGGGYCLAPTHSLQDHSPTENVVAMYQAAHDFGRYL